MTILIKSTLKRQGPAASTVRARLEKVLAAASLEDAELSILFVGDRAMRTLNRTYRGKDRTTDVLSFAFREGAFGSLHAHMLGDIVISLPAAVRQARAAGEPLLREVDRLLIHGLLHLLGYDHERGAAQERLMRAAERKLLRVLGR